MQESVRSFVRLFVAIIVIVVGVSRAHAQGYQVQALNKGPLYSNASLLDDVDGDGDLDIVIIRAAINGQPPAIEWLENDPSQQFPRHLLYADDSLKRPLDIKKCDCDGDGRTDYVIADSGTGIGGSPGQLFWLQRQANGTYIKWTLEAGPDFDQADVADFNHDGKPDIVGVAGNLKTVNLYLNAGSLNFTKSTLATPVSGVDQVQAVDIDGDGDIDIVCSGWIFRNNGSATFDAGQQMITYVCNCFARGMMVTDLNGDGKMDVLAFSSSGPGGLYFFDGSKNYAGSVLENQGIDLGGDIKVADIDGNGLKDIIRQNVGDNNASVLYQDTPMTFRRTILARNCDCSTSRMAVGDLDGDGDLDLVLPGNGIFESNFYWFENIGGRLFQHRLYGTFTGVRSVKVADVDGDGDLDLVVAIGQSCCVTDDHLLWFENRGPQGFVNWLIADDLKFPAGIETADVNGDGKLDVIVSASGNNSLLWYERNGPLWSQHTIDGNLNNPLGVAVGDIDRDGDVDVAVASGNDAKVFWYANDGHGTFQRRVVDANLTNPRAVKIADIDNDGDLDLVAAAASDTGSAAAYINDGSQNFSRRILQTGLIGSDVDVGDRNGNGAPDIVVAYNSSKTSDPDVVAYEYQPGGTFAATTLVTALHNVTAVRLADVDRDGRLDLLVGSDTPGDTSPLELYLANNPQPVDLLPKASGEVLSIDAGNLDGDNAPEIVATEFRFGSLFRVDSNAGGGPAAPLVTFNVVPSVINLGDSVVLSWSTMNAGSVVIDHGVGSVGASGSKSFAGLLTPATFNLTATGVGGTTTATATVTVLNPLTAGITAVPSAIHTGGTATLSFSSTGATSVTLNDGTTNQPVAAQGTKSVSPAQSTHYTLSAQNGSFVVSSSTDVTVLPAAAPVINSFTVTPSSIPSQAAVTLLWSSSGGTSATIDQRVGNVNPVSGSALVAPGVTTTYTLTVKGPGGVTMRSATVLVANSQPAMVSTLAGTGQPGSSDGMPGVATFTKPFAVAVMPHATSGKGIRADATTLSFDIFILDSNHTIRRVAPDGMTTTFAGVAGVRGAKNGFRTDATFDFSNFTGAITANTDGTFEVVDANGLQRHIDSAGNVANLCASCARYPLPAGVVRLADRTTYISDAGNHTITRVSAAGALTVIGIAGQAGFRDGPADQALFNRPRGLTVDGSNNVYVLDTGNNAIRRISTANVVATLTVAGSTTSSGDLILGCCAGGIVAAPGGGVYITDPGSNTIKQVGSDGSITTVAGSGSTGSANGNGSTASFNNPLGIAVAPNGSLVVTDTENNTVRSVQPPPMSSRHRAVKH
jgi:hypothetical protein